MICPNCNKEYDGKFCPECGTKLIEKPSAGGFNLNFGDANAISGGVNLSDSHNVHNEDKSVHNISNVSNVTNNVTNVAAQKTEMELLQEKKTLYLNECKRANEDNVLDKAEIIALEEYRLKIGLDKATADKILEKVRQMTVGKATKTDLNPIAKIKLKQLTERLQKNEIKALMNQIDELEPLLNKYDHDELQRKYYLVLSALKSEKCIERYESTPADNYWESFFTYLAYCKVGQTYEAEEILASMDRFVDYPEDNITLLAVAGSLIKGENAEAKDYLSAVTGDYTPALQRFVDSIYLLLEPAMAKEMGANENTCAFYLVNFFNQEDPKERARKEAEAKAAEEARRQAAEKAAKEKAAAEEKARKEAEAKRKREEEERRRAEEQKRREEGARRRATEAEAKRRAEEEEQKRKEEKARNQITYIVMIKNVSNQVLATMTLWTVLKWRSVDTPQKLKTLPCEVYRGSNESEAKRIYGRLSNGSMTLDIERVNGLGESMRKLFVLTITEINGRLQSVVSSCEVLKLPPTTTTTQALVAKLPAVALVTEDKSEVVATYNKLVRSGVTVNIKMTNGFGDTILENVPLYNVILKSIKPQKEYDMWMFTLPSYGIKRMTRVLPIVVSTVISQESGQRIVKRLIEKGADEVTIQPIEDKTECTERKREQIKTTEKPQSNSEYYDVQLTSIRGTMLDVVKVLKATCGFMIKDATSIAGDVLIGIPQIIKERLPEDEAMALKEEFEDSGATVTLLSRK